ncbi:MAG: molecular chaperone TorD family protein [Dehalococcoidia bacterium]|nr:molecular chaperone TorD family protein [Dehalococcoidia bacterium]
MVVTERSLGTAAAEARRSIYELLREAFAFPTPELHDALRCGRWQSRFLEAASRLPYRLPMACGLQVPKDLRRLQDGYVALFDVGFRGPPCPLYSGHYARDRMRVMEELVRFYHFFGLRLRPGHLPDHITVLLEFMQRLAAAEAASGADAPSLRRAQRDFLARHLLWWVPQLARSVARRQAPRFYKALTALTARFLGSDQRYLTLLTDGGGGDR